MRIIIEYDAIGKVWTYRKFRDGIEVHRATFESYRAAWRYAEELGTDLPALKS